MTIMLFYRIVLFFCALFISFNIAAQTYVGLSANLGNRLNYSPASPGLERPISISGSLLLTVQQRLKNDWFIQYGGGLGILSYNLKIISIDTLSSPSTYSFLEYSTFYGNLNLLAGKEISIKEKKLLVGLGGGATYYFSSFPYTTYNIFEGLGNNSEMVFYAEINSPEVRFIPFAKMAIQLMLNKHFVLGIEYSYHFESVLSGTYEFFHTKEPSTGDISLYQREFKVVFLVKI